MASDCCTNASVLLYACSGGSNVGQLTNEAAKAMDGLGKGRMSCAIGVGAAVPSFVADAADSTTVVLDGCDIACVARAFERAGRTVDVHVIVTQLGIKKEHNFDLPQEDIATVAGAASDALDAKAPASSASPS